MSLSVPWYGAVPLQGKSNKEDMAHENSPDCPAHPGTFLPSLTLVRQSLRPISPGSKTTRAIYSLLLSSLSMGIACRVVFSYYSPTLFLHFTCPSFPSPPAAVHKQTNGA